MSELHTIPLPLEADKVKKLKKLGFEQKNSTMIVPAKYNVTKSIEHKPKDNSGKQTYLVFSGKKLIVKITSWWDVMNGAGVNTNF